MEVYCELEFKSDSFDDERKKILAQYKLSTKYSLLENGKIVVPNTLVQAVRVQSLSEEELYFGDVQQSSDLIQKMITPINEFRTLKFLNKKILELKKLYPTLDFSNAQSQLREMCAAFCSLGKQDKPLHIDNDQKIKQLFAWAKEQGIEYPESLQPGIFSSTGRGFFASNSIQKGDLVIKLPRHLIFNIDAALESPFGPLFKDLISQGVHEDTIVLIFTIHERHSRDSKWAPYFDILPYDVDIGLTMPVEDLLQLEGLPLLMDIVMAKEQLQSYYDSIFPSLSEQAPQMFPESIYTFENFLWARSVFESRGFSFTINGQVRNCLLPFVDMLNTSNYPQLESKFDDVSQEFQVNAFSDCNGTQLYINYGPYSNRELFLNYGFMIDNNPYDRFRISFEIPLDTYYNTKSELLEKHGLSLDHYLRRGPVSTKLWAALRVCMLSEEDVKQVSEKGFDPMEVVSEENEANVKSSFAMVLEGLLEAFEDDMSEDDLSWAAQYRRNQKEILIFNQQFVNV